MIDDHIFQEHDEYYDRGQTEVNYKKAFDIIEILFEILFIILELFE